MKWPCDEAAIRTGNPDTPRAAKARPWILTATILGSSMAFIDSTVVNVALPQLQASLGATVVDVQWVVESYGLFLSALILVGGALGDRLGRRRVFLVGVGIFAAASAGCGLAASIHQLVLARSIQGVGAALMVPGSLAIISATFDEKSRGQAIGTWSGFTAITTALGPVLGGWLIEHASWRWAFFLNLPLAAAVVATSFVHVPETRSLSARYIDWRGALLATVGLGGVIFGFVESVNLGWRNPLVWGSLAVGAACLAGLLPIEARTSSAMIPLTLFRSRNFAGANLLTLFLYAALGIFFFLFPMDFVQVQAYSMTATGAAALPAILLMFFLSRWSGGLVSRWGPKVPLIGGPLIAAAGFALFALPSIGGSYWTTFFPGFVVLGLGMAVTVAPLTTVVMSSVDQEHVGSASGINNAVARVAGVLAIAVLGIVMVKAFSFHLHSGLSPLTLPPDVVHALTSSQTKLAALDIPAGLDTNTTAAVHRAVSEAFVFGFRLVMLLCAGLSVAAGAIAGLMLSSRGNPGAGAGTADGHVPVLRTPRAR